MVVTTILIGLIGCILVGEASPLLYPHVLGFYGVALVVDWCIWMYKS
jgi:hypothetical protein